jgi:hypothetical protein
VINQPGDVRFVLDQVLALAKRAARGSRAASIAIALRPPGCPTAAHHAPRRLPSDARDERFRAAVGIAPVACPSTRRSTGRRVRPAADPGTQDLLVPIETNAARAVANASSARELVVLAAATHTAFSGLISFPSQESYDVPLGCPVVVDEFGANWQRLQTLTDPANGITIASCDMPCIGPVPTNVPMQAARQHDLTRATVVAFLESTLRRSRPARCFVRQALAAENADVHVELHGRGR